MPGPSNSFLGRMFGQDNTGLEELSENIKRRRYEEDLRRHGMRVPTFDDVSGISGPMAGVTKFVKAGIPQVAERMGSTQQFLNAMKGLGSKASDAAELFAQRYPRIAAHISPYKYMGHKSTLGITDINPSKITKVGFNINNPEIESTLLHEGTHVAQKLGNPKLPELYGHVTRGMESKGLSPEMAYKLNPFERSARRVAERKLGANLPPVKSLEELAHIVELLPPGDPDRLEMARILLSRR